MRKSKGSGIGFKMAAEMAVPAPSDSLAEVLQDLYAAELNVSISSFWDKGWTIKLGDDVNSWVSLVHFDGAEFDGIVTCLRNELERRTKNK